MSFEKIIDFTLKWEGGNKITRDPHDPGGVTKYGISHKAHPSVDIENLTLDEAKVIYKMEYWDKIAKGEDDNLDMVCFDTSVNLGVGRVRKWLREGITYKDILEDRRDWYNYLTIINPKMGKYLKGWMNRCDALEKFIGEM
jgi:lysozyme family protein